MCGGDFRQDRDVDFELIEVGPEKAGKIGVEAGFMYLLSYKKTLSSGKKQKEIRKIVLWTNAEHGYLGLNYHIWPWYKRLLAHWRIFVCRHSKSSNKQADCPLYPNSSWLAAD